MQTTDSVLMIRPVRFTCNPDTVLSNRFQHADIHPDLAQVRALMEFDNYVDVLREHGVHVLVVDDTVEPHTPDSIFPNNWLSSHEDGTLILYPMEGPNRRLERSERVLAALDMQFERKRTVDLSHFESRGAFLEGTGSMVLDRDHKIGYACHSSRTSPEVMAAFADEMGYRLLSFHAFDRTGTPIYHTNVMMCVGRKLAVVCLDSIPAPGERKRVASSLRETNKAIVEISHEQLAAFAGNMLELHDAAGEGLLVMSRSAWQSLRPDQRQIITEQTKPLVVEIDTIERLGGGSARCMLADIYLARRDHAAIL